MIRWYFTSAPELLWRFKYWTLIGWSLFVAGYQWGASNLEIRTTCENIGISTSLWTLMSVCWLVGCLVGTCLLMTLYSSNLLWQCIIEGFHCDLDNSVFVSLYREFFVLIMYCTLSHMLGHVTSSANGQPYTIKINNFFLMRLLKHSEMYFNYLISSLFS